MTTTIAKQKNLPEEFRLMKKAKECPFPVPSSSYFFLNGEAFSIKELAENNLEFKNNL